MEQLFQSFCSGGSSCSRAAAGGTEAPRPPGPASARDGTEDVPGSLLEALTLKPSVVDDGELQFPPRSQARCPPRGNSAATRQKMAANSRYAGSQYHVYTGADFQDVPSIGNSPGPRGGGSLGSMFSEFQDMASGRPQLGEAVGKVQGFSPMKELNPPLRRPP
ncbi:unnamed protein product [Polarella glacialis]|uniref:Uncharacterized protein n=1 Tax=Polarella glacialis TaxID=89957 RepID=A0A813DLX7_POLGL|nr:unnamed protein product [Polarella glacialis]